MRRAILLLLLAVPLFAEPERGQLIENIPTRADATQTYTLYLPASYDPAKKHPLLFIFDPRGRATVAARLFRDGAEEHGWILLSSNDTRSDESSDPNERALRALIPEAARYAVDTKRVYAAGFSGTAIIAWGYAMQMGGFAGVIGVGGRLVDEVPPEEFNFAHFGFTGETDFNNREMRMVDAELERAGKTHRLQIFPGDHGWMPAADARDAIAWMELMAMKAQLRPRDEAMIAREYARDVAAAAAISPALEALRRYRAIVRTFDGLHSVDDARAAAVKLERDAAVQRELKAEQKWDAFEVDYLRNTLGRIPQVFATLRQEEVPDVRGRLLREFKVGELQRRAKAPGVEGVTARRLLTAVDGQMGFYLMRQLFARREYRLAIGTLGVSDAIAANRPHILYNLAAAHARLGEMRQAIELLTKAVEHGFRDLEYLQKDEDFAALRDDEGFRRALQSWQSTRK